MKDTTNQTQDTANNDDISARARANRRIDAMTISELAKLCAKQLTESEACRRLGISPRSWFNWKVKHNRAEKFSALLEAFRADRIDSLIAKIEASADGIGLKQPDWRAAAALLKFADQKRFGEGAAVEVNVMRPMISEADVKKAIAMAIRANELEDKEKVIEAAPAPKLIEDARND